MPKDGGTNDTMTGNGCPDEMAVASYLDGRMSPEQEQAMALHLSRCPSCAQAVAELRGLLASSGPEDEEGARQAAERAKKIIKG